MKYVVKTLNEDVNHLFHQATDAERQLVADLPQMWDDLLLKSKNVDASLIVVKKKFTEITQVQIGEFGIELQKFQERFKEEGPGAVVH